MKQMTRTAASLAAVAFFLAACGAAASPSPSPEESVARSVPESVAVSASPEPTATPAPTVTPGPTPVAQQDLDLDLTLTYAKGEITGPGTCSIGPDGIWIYLEHRTNGALDVYLTVGAAQGGVGGGAVTGGGQFGPEAVRVRIYDLVVGGFIDTENAQADLDPDLRTGSFSGTWSGEPLTADYTCS